MVGDFTTMIDSPNGDEVFVINILHKSFIEVNEECIKAEASVYSF
jgi:hypothetical protein